MKKIYIAPTTLCLGLHTTNMMALSLSDETVDSENMGGFEQNTKGRGSWADTWDEDDE